MALCARYVGRYYRIRTTCYCIAVGNEWNGVTVSDLVGGRRWLRRRRPAVKRALERDPLENKREVSDVYTKHNLVKAVEELPVKKLEKDAVTALDRIGFHEFSHGELAVLLRNLAKRIPGRGVNFPDLLSRIAGYVSRNWRTFTEGQLIAVVWALTHLRGVDAQMDDLFLAVDRSCGKRLHTLSPHSIELLAQAIRRSDQYPCALALRPKTLNAFVESMEKFSAQKIVRVTSYLGEHQTWESKSSSAPFIEAQHLEKMGRLLAGNLSKLNNTELARVAGVLIFNKYEPKHYTELLTAMRNEFLYRSASLNTKSLSYISAFLASAGYLDSRSLQQIQLKFREHVQAVKPTDIVHVLNALSRDGVSDRKQAHQLAQEFAKTAQNQTASFTPGQCAALLRCLLALNSCSLVLAEDLASRALLGIASLTPTELAWLALGISMAEENRGLADDLATMANKTVLDSTSLTVPMACAFSTAMIKLRLRHENWLDAIAKFAIELLNNGQWDEGLVSVTTSAFSLLAYPCRQFFQKAARYYEKNMALFEKKNLQSRTYFIFACALNDLYPRVLCSHVNSLFPEHVAHLDTAGRRALVDTHLLAKSKGVESGALLSKVALEELISRMNLSRPRDVKKIEISFVACVRQLCGQGTVLSDVDLAYFGHVGAALLVDKNNHPASWPRHATLSKMPLTADDLPNHTMIILLLLSKFEFCLQSSQLRGRMVATVRAMNAVRVRVLPINLSKWVSSGDLSGFMVKELLNFDVALPNDVQADV